MDELVKGKYWKSLLRNMKESAFLKEETICKEIELAKTDPKIRAFLEVYYLDENREASFERFCNSMEFKVMFEEITRHTKYDWNAKICEVGAGSGFLAVALAKSGFSNVSILEPNENWITGTGFIADYARKHGVTIWNNLDSWYQSDDKYDLIITKACVHHFDNVCKVAAEIRCKIDDNGEWLMFDESFANSTQELYQALTCHPHVYKYAQYEWPYSAILYVGLLDLAGYKLDEVIPFRYKGNYIARNVSDKARFSKLVTIVTRILVHLKSTVIFLKIESLIDRYFGMTAKLRLFTRPQLLVFRLKKVNLPSLPERNVSIQAAGITHDPPQYSIPQGLMI
jgi:hypothetical protein